jgi:hypothetical protein
MVNAFDPNSSSVASASIGAELDKIVENFGKLLQSGNEAAELLMIKTGRECRNSNNLKQNKVVQCSEAFRLLLIAVSTPKY